MIINLLFFGLFALVGTGALAIFLAVTVSAILTREMDAAMVYAMLFSGAFACGFGGIGYWGIVTTIGGARRERRREALRQIHPSQPWEWREDWKTGTLQSSRTQAAGVLVWGALFFNLTVWALSIFPAGTDFPSWSFALFLVAKIVGAAGAVVALKAARASWRGRSTRMQLNSTPAWVGSRLSGQIYLRQNSAVKPTGLTLECNRRITESEPGKTTITETTLFSTAHELDQNQMFGEAFAVDIPIPADAPGTDAEHAWRLHVTASGERIATFEIPVFGR